MKIIGFIGAYDKIDLILYIAKILATAKKKVLVIDATLNQKTRYIVPSIMQTKAYITEFEGFDVAVGFNDLNEIKEYTGSDEKNFNYDIVICDIDNIDSMKNLDVSNNYKNLFVTAFDLYSLKKGLEIIRGLYLPLKLSKVLFSENMTKEENEYLNYLASGYRIEWDRNIFTFPLEFVNYSATVENQITGRIRIKGLSNNYKEALEYLVENVFDQEISKKEIIQIFKRLEREL